MLIINIFLNFSAAKKAKDSHTNDINRSYTRSSTRGITQVPEQLSMHHTDHEMDDEDDMEHDDEDNHTGTDNDQQQPESPTMTNGSDELNEYKNTINDDDEQQQHIQPPSIITSTHQRKRMLPLTNHRRLPPPSSSSSTMNGKSDLFSVRAHLEKGKIISNSFKLINFFCKALRDLDRAIISKDEYHDGDEHRLIPIRNHSLINGHRHSKLDDIVRSLSSVVNQQQENARLIIDESSVLLLDDEHQKNDKQSITTQESIKNVLERLNTLVDRGNSIYDRIESILSEF